MKAVKQWSGKPVTAGTQRSSDELHVDESRQDDNERRMTACTACNRGAGPEPVYHRSPYKPPLSVREQLY